MCLNVKGKGSTVNVWSGGRGEVEVVNLEMNIINLHAAYR